MSSIRKGTVELDRNAIRDSKKSFREDGLVIWLTGLPAAGKTTIANELHNQMDVQGLQVQLLDGDDLRKGICADLGFNEKDRKENIRRVGEIAKMMKSGGAVVLVALISPYRESRQQVRSMFSPGEFIEVFVDCPVSECKQRDPKGMYARAQQGKIDHFTGISAPYEPPEHSEIHIDTYRQTVKECVVQILAYLEKLDMPDT